MSPHPAVRVRTCAPSAEARRLAARLTRGGIVSAPDDGGDAEVRVTVGLAPGELAPVRARCQVLCAVGAPAGPYFAAGADEVVVPGEPEILFRRLKLWIERADLHARLERLTQRAIECRGILDLAGDHPDGKNRAVICQGHSVAIQDAAARHRLPAMARPAVHVHEQPGARCYGVFPHSTELGRRARRPNRNLAAPRLNRSSPPARFAQNPPTRRHSGWTPQVASSESIF